MQIYLAAGALLQKGDMDGGVLLALHQMEEAVNKGPPNIWEREPGM